MRGKENKPISERSWNTLEKKKKIRQTLMAGREVEMRSNKRCYTGSSVMPSGKPGDFKNVESLGETSVEAALDLVIRFLQKKKEKKLLLSSIQPAAFLVVMLDVKML